MSQQMVDLMEAVWKSIDGLCAGLAQEQWALPTECPGWSVQDQVSHLVGSECRILGRPAPAHEPADTAHVRNEVGQGNEVLVDYRRQFSGADVLVEFREITAERMGVLRGMSEADFAAETDNPLGRGPYTDLLAIRIYDAWVHEQDMRRTLGISWPPGRTGGAARLRPDRDGNAIRGGTQGQARRRHDGGVRDHRRGGRHHRTEHGWRSRPPDGPCSRFANSTAHHGPRALQRTGHRPLDRRTRPLATGSVCHCWRPSAGGAYRGGNELYDLTGADAIIIQKAR